MAHFIHQNFFLDLLDVSFLVHDGKDCNVNNIDELKEILSLSGKTEINLVVNDNDKKACYSLQNNKKVDLKLLKTLKSKEYVTKISV